MSSAGNRDVCQALTDYCNKGYGKAGPAINRFSLKIASLRDVGAVDGQGGPLWRKKAWRNSSVPFQVDGK